MTLPFSTDFFDSLAYQIMRSQRLGLPHITRALVFQAVDAMAFADSEGDQLSKEAFVQWSEKNLLFSVPVTGEELFKARQKHLPPLKKRVALRGAGRVISFEDSPEAEEVAVTAGPVRVCIRTDVFADVFLMGMTAFMHRLKKDAPAGQQVVGRLGRLPFGWRAVMSVLADEMRLRELPDLGGRGSGAQTAKAAA
jgi:hypothetical protein